MLEIQVFLIQVEQLSDIGKNQAQKYRVAVAALDEAKKIM
jgi:hypothetical protein